MAALRLLSPRGSATPSNTLQVTVNGELWWGGFAELTVSNPRIKRWTTGVSAIGPHALESDGWGVEDTEPLGMAQPLPWAHRGDKAFLPVANPRWIRARQGVDLGREGALTESMLMLESANFTVTPRRLPARPCPRPQRATGVPLTSPPGASTARTTIQNTTSWWGRDDHEALRLTTV